MNTFWLGRGVETLGLSLPYSESSVQVSTGGAGGRKKPKRGLFKDLPSEFFFEPSEEQIEEVVKDDQPIQIAFTPPPRLVQAPAISLNAMPLSEIKDEIEREIASIIREKQLQLFADREAEQDRIEAEFKRKLAVMMILVLEES